MKWSLLLFTLFISELCVAQNLILNSSFEDFYTCKDEPANPQTNPQRPYGWFYIARTGITGYYLDLLGSTGDRNLELIIGSDYGEMRTYWETVLLQKVQKGKRYKIKLNLASTFGDGPNLNDIGFYIADSLFFTTKEDTVFQPAEYINFLDSKVGKPKNRWFAIEKEFIATSNNQILIVGNFSRKNYQKIVTDRPRNSKYTTIHVDDLSITPSEKNPCTDCEKIRDSLYLMSRYHACYLTQEKIVHDTIADTIYRPTIDTVVINTDFLFASNNFKMSNPDSLESIRAIVSKNHIIKIRIVGYTDDTGTTEYNSTLSLKRAQAVADILTNKLGVNNDIIEIFGNGISTKFADKSKNRRVEIYVYR